MKREYSENQKKTDRRETIDFLYLQKPRLPPDIVGAKMRIAVLWENRNSGCDDDSRFIAAADWLINVGFFAAKPAPE